MDKFSILFVDDDPAIRRVFQDSLPDSQVLLAATPQEARAQLQQSAQQIAIIVVDHYLATYSGVDLLAEVRQQWPEIIRIWTTSADNLDQSIGAINNGGIFSYIMKPWTKKDLKKQLQKANQAFSKRQEELILIKSKKEAAYTLASSIAHELNTPLTSIQFGLKAVHNNFSELMSVYQTAVNNNLVSDPLPVRNLKLISSTHERCISDINRSRTIIKMMLASAGLESRQEIEIKSENIKEIIDTTIENYPFNPNLRTSITLKSKENIYASINRDLFILAILNIVKNADYAIQANGTGSIEIKVCSNKNNALITITDTGTGISKKSINKIFDDFFTTKSLGSGSGLGLPFCKRVVALFNGKIWCESQEGEYSSFFISLKKDRVH